MPHTSASVAIGDIAIGQSGPYAIAQDSLGDIPQIWRHLAVSSPWADGAFLVHATRDQGTLSVGVKVSGDSVEDLIQKILALRQQLAEFSYEVTVTVGSVSTTWLAWPGNVVRVGGTWQDDRLLTHHQLLNVSIPVYPVPLGEGEQS